MSTPYRTITKHHNAAYILRQLSEPYLKSNKHFDNAQGQILINMAEDIINNDLPSAKLRFDVLHSDLRTSLPFSILDLMDKAEMAFK